MLMVWFRDADGVEHEHFLPEHDESEMLLVVSEVPSKNATSYDDGRLDLVGLDRVVDVDDGSVSLNVGHWENFGDPLEGDWFPVFQMDTEYMAARRREVGNDDDYDRRRFRRQAFNPTP